MDNDDDILGDEISYGESLDPEEFEELHKGSGLYLNNEALDNDLVSLNDRSFSESKFEEALGEFNGSFDFAGENNPDFDVDNGNTALDREQYVGSLESSINSSINDMSKTTSIQNVKGTPPTNFPTLNIQPAQPKPKICQREKMRKWLNRQHTENPETSFLGKPYYEIGVTKYGSNHQDPPINSGGQLTEGDDASNKIKRICQCNFGKKRTTNKKRDTVERSGENVRPRDGIEEDSKSDLQGLASQMDVDNLTKKSDYTSHRVRPGCAYDPKNIAHSRKSFKPQEFLNKFMQSIRPCSCKKSGWMSSRLYRKRINRCVCRSRKNKRKAAEMKKVQENLIEKQILDAEHKLREPKIEQLFEMIGPKLAKEYRELAKMHSSTRRRSTNKFARKITEQFGPHLRKYKSLSLQDGVLYRDTNIPSESFQYVEIGNGSCYYGQYSSRGMDGKCIYKMAHGPIFVGSMSAGKMSGVGKLIYPTGGVIDGVWVNGILYEPKYTFADGLQFQPFNWKYCRIPDRRFLSEIIRGLNPPDNDQLCADHPARQIPKGCLDAVEGFYDPVRRVILHPSTGEITRIVGEQEGNWILQNCRREWFQEVPFSRYLYENWYAGTVFPPPGDEPDWFEQEFPKLPSKLVNGSTVNNGYR